MVISVVLAIDLYVKMSQSLLENRRNCVQVTKPTFAWLTQTETDVEGLKVEWNGRKGARRAGSGGVVSRIKTAMMLHALRSLGGLKMVHFRLDETKESSER